MLKKIAGGVCALVSSFFVAGSAAGQAAIMPPEEYVELKAELKMEGPVLLFSDSPEMVYENGILYRDIVQGDIRLFFHHVNAVKEDKKLAVLLKNVDQLRPVKYEVVRKGIGGNSWDYLRDGKEAEKKYFDDSLQETISGRIGFSNAHELITGRGSILKKDKLLTGFIDLRIERPLQLSVMMCDPRTAIEIFSDNAPVLPMDEHPLRGTFPNANWNYRLRHPIEPGGNSYMLKLAGPENYIRGIDATTGMPAENYGNYGVVYEMDFKIGGDDPVKFIFNPIGGPFAGYGVLESKKGRKLIGMPGGRVDIGTTVNDAVVLSTLLPGDYKFYWSPPGAGNLPVQFFWQAAKNI